MPNKKEYKGLRYGPSLLLPPVKGKLEGSHQGKADKERIRGCRGCSSREFAPEDEGHPQGAKVSH